MSLLTPYVPLISPPPAPTSPYVGSGSPEGVVVASPGRTYLDEDTDELYFKETGEGTDTGWVLVSGGGGGSSTIIGTGSPEGVQTRAAGTRFFATDTRTMWFKETGSGNTGWIEEFTLPS